MSLTGSKSQSSALHSLLEDLLNSGGWSQLQSMRRARPDGLVEGVHRDALTFAKGRTSSYSSFVEGLEQVLEEKAPASPGAGSGGAGLAGLKPSADPEPKEPPIVDQLGSTTGAAAQEQKGGGVTYDQEALGAGPSPDEAIKILKDAGKEQPGGMYGKQGACDRLGRITTAKDGSFCDGADACVTSLPEDFEAKTHAPWCWRWVAPPCDPPPPCDPSSGYCPPQNCPQPHWEDVCAKNVGQPWCVRPQDLVKYGGPIEVKCSASGQGAFHKGSPTGCWWLHKYVKVDLQRFPGPIVDDNEEARPEGVDGWKVKSGPEGMSWEEARKWVILGQLPGSPKKSIKAAEFLA